MMARQIEKKTAEEIVTVCKYVNFSNFPHADEQTNQIVIEDSFCQPVVAQNPDVLAKDHPMNFIKMNKLSVAIQKRVRANGFMRTANGEWTYKQPESNRFALGILFEELVGGTFAAHYAQQDTEALMHVCLSFGDDFTQFADNCAANIPF
uniref:Uncharacterized protein n=1 Tax=Caenorhabditis japonica TaxID=281687 RepID=A0A8R1DY07_CAEJA